MQKSKIEWTEYTWNPWSGCHKVSEGCKNCYMFREKARFRLNGNVIIKSQHNTFNKPLRIKEPAAIFVCAYSDFFIEHPEADEWRRQAWDIMRRTPQHTYLILTKRPERIVDCLPGDWGEGYDNVWLGISAENQKEYDSRIFFLSQIKAKHKFISFEPLLSEIKMLGDGYELIKGIDWIIAGGESGHSKGEYKFRECKIEWLESLQAESKEVKKPFYLKQLGTYLSKELKLKSDPHGRILKNFPKKLQVRKLPKGIKVLKEN